MIFKFLLASAAARQRTPTAVRASLGLFCGERDAGAARNCGHTVGEGFTVPYGSRKSKEGRRQVVADVGHGFWVVVRDLSAVLGGGGSVCRGCWAGGGMAAGR